MWYSTSNSLACQFLNLFISSDFFFPVHVSHSHFMPCKLSPPFNILSLKLLIQMWHTLTTTFQVAGSTSPTITITDPTYSTFFFLFIKVFFSLSSLSNLGCIEHHCSTTTANTTDLLPHYDVVVDEENDVFVLI